MIPDLFAQFVQEKRYLQNLSPRTIEFYDKDVFTRWMRYVGEMPINHYTRSYLKNKP